ncbi:MAG: GWxTD domain-containing protein [Flavobacteriales bacterium]|nr:GWxTD domain-containing protein [Flavobacteriales bacterium]
MENTWTNMRAKRNMNILLLFAGLILAYACSAPKNTASNNNVAGIYMPGLNLINPQYRVFHKNDTLTELHFRLNSSNILYTKKRNDSTYSANILIHYELIDKADESLLDSASISFTDFGNNKQKKHLYGTINLQTKTNKVYDLLITVNDISRDHYIKNRIVITRTNLYSVQNYLLLDSNKNVVFENYFNQNDLIYLTKNERNAANNILLKRYSTDLPIAKPPFSVNEDGQEEPLVFKPVNTETLEFDSTNTLTYRVGEEGLYHFQHTEDNKSGTTFFNFQPYFPEIKTPEAMIGPMRYITTKKEYDQLMESENTKLAVDKFWISIAGSSERAKTMIREYYTRVESANNYFTSYLEGWKTDRGIIYIIFGSPNVVYKNKDYENWIYGEENNMMSISFVFHKVENPVSGNDYQLSRSPIFKNTWFRAVDSWRSGRIY